MNTTEPITKENFLKRAEAYIAGLSDHDRKHLPICSSKEHPAELERWQRYFDNHLKWRPRAFKMVMRGELKNFTAPSSRPEYFDSSYIPPPDHNDR